MRGPARFATYLGRILMALGFIMILLAWDGAAGLDFIQGQFPYLLSGAVPGLALIIIGAGTEYIQAVRQFTAERAKHMAELNLAVLKLVKFAREDGALQAPRSDATDDAPTGTPAQRRDVQTPAVAETAAFAPQRSATATATKDAPKPNPNDDRVVAGRSSFHDPECHLVTGRDDMATLTRVEAEGQGLNPCKVCKP